MGTRTRHLRPVVKYLITCQECGDKFEHFSRQAQSKDKMKKKLCDRCLYKHQYARVVKKKRLLKS